MRERHFGVVRSRTLRSRNRRLLRQQRERSGHEPPVYNPPRGVRLANRVAQAIRGVRIAMIIDVRAIDEVRLAIDPHGQVATVAGELETALAARGLDDHDGFGFRSRIRALATAADDRDDSRHDHADKTGSCSVHEFTYRVSDSREKLTTGANDTQDPRETQSRLPTAGFQRPRVARRSARSRRPSSRDRAWSIQMRIPSP